MLGRLYWVSVELEASLAPAEAEVGAVAKADQKLFVTQVRNFAKVIMAKMHQPLV